MRLQSEGLWQQYYKETIHRINDIVLSYDKDGKLVNWNLAAVHELGYEGQELTGLTVHSFFHSELPLLSMGERSYCQEIQEVPIYRKDNTCFTGDLRILSVGDQKLFGICIIHNSQVVKDLKLQIATLSDELKHANEVKNLFLANMTHELRTPLNGMIGLLTMMDTTAFSESTKEDVKILQNCCKTMEKTVNQVLEYTKLSAGKRTMNVESFAIATWITPIIRLYQSACQVKGLHFEARLDAELPECLMGDKDWIGQVLNNLLNNAVKFTSQGSVRLEIILKEDNKSYVTVLFVVSDTGIGIRDEQLKLLFQSFVQADPSITREYGGTGLGLAISKGIVESMGGHLEVESTYTKGSRFYFELALARGNLEEICVEHGDEDSSIGGYKDGADEEYQIRFKNVGSNIENERNIAYLLRQISLCIELKAWGRAQTFCHRMKELVKEQNPEFGKWTFRLELAARRKDAKKAELIYNELKMALDSDEGGFL